MLLEEFSWISVNLFWLYNYLPIAIGCLWHFGQGHTQQTPLVDFASNKTQVIILPSFYSHDILDFLRTSISDMAHARIKDRQVMLIKYHTCNAIILNSWLMTLLNRLFSCISTSNRCKPARNVLDSWYLHAICFLASISVQDGRISAVLLCWNGLSCCGWLKGGLSLQ